MKNILAVLIAVLFLTVNGFSQQEVPFKGTAEFRGTVDTMKLAEAIVVALKKVPSSTASVTKPVVKPSAPKPLAVRPLSPEDLAAIVMAVKTGIPQAPAPVVNINMPETSAAIIKAAEIQAQGLVLAAKETARAMIEAASLQAKAVQYTADRRHEDIIATLDSQEQIAKMNRRPWWERTINAFLTGGSAGLFAGPLRKADRFDFNLSATGGSVQNSGNNTLNNEFNPTNSNVFNPSNTFNPTNNPSFTNSPSFVNNPQFTNSPSFVNNNNPVFNNRNVVGSTGTGSGMGQLFCFNWMGGLLCSPTTPNIPTLPVPGRQ